MRRFSGFWWSPGREAPRLQGVRHHRRWRQSTIVDVMHPEQRRRRVPLPARRQGQRRGAPGPHPVDRRQDDRGWSGTRRRTRTWPGWRWPKRRPADAAGAEPHADGGAAARGRPSTGKHAALLTEKDEAWVNLEQPFPRWLDGWQRLPLVHRAQRRPRGGAAQRGRQPRAHAGEAGRGLPRLVRASPRATGRSTSSAAPTPPSATSARRWRAAAPERVTPARRPAPQRAAASPSRAAPSSSTSPRRTTHAAPCVVLRRTARAWASCPPSPTEPPVHARTLELRQVGPASASGRPSSARATSSPGQKLPGHRRASTAAPPPPWCTRPWRSLPAQPVDGGPGLPRREVRRARHPAARPRLGARGEVRLRRRHAGGPGRRPAGAGRRRCPSWT